MVLVKAAQRQARCLSGEAIGLPSPVLAHLDDVPEGHIAAQARQVGLAVPERLQA